MELEKVSTVSPLLSEPVIQRDYTKSIENQFQEGFTSNQPTDQEMNKGGDGDFTGQNKGASADPFAEPSSTGFADFDNPKGFSFDEENEDPSDANDGDEPGFNLAAGSAKVFANVVGDIVKTKVPEMSYQAVKVDMASIETHILNGNIHVAARDAFNSINTITRDALEFSDDEIKMWKKAFKEFLEYKNVKAANPETAFYIASFTLAFTHILKIRELKKNNRQYIIDAINSYNPGYFDSFHAKNAKQPEQQAEAAPQPEPEKQTEKKTEKEKL